MNGRSEKKVLGVGDSAELLRKLDVIEKDIIEIWGEVGGTHKYESQAGWDITVPSIDVKYYRK